MKMTTQLMETLQVTTPTEREVVLTRTFDAPRAQVFDALTRPELLKRWLVAPGRTLQICEIDLRPGGAYHYVWRGPGKTDIGMRGVHHEVVPLERIVRTEAWEDWDAGDSLVTTVLHEESGKTRFTTTILFPSREVRDAVVKSGLEHGAEEGYDKLDALLSMKASMKLELVPVPVSDIDRAKAFYVEKIGFHADHDMQPNETVRVCQLTPPGSACSIVLGAGLPGIAMPAGSLRGLHLVVADIVESRATLVARGVTVGQVIDLGGIKFAPFSDPDGNTWTLQEIPSGR
jgi:uncharacterized protein YndB with AHSA1/START domain/catechol 2,3-dioxygenase-like lactoylglutathione lyase family enzyme